jgi:hypothetical protein
LLALLDRLVFRIAPCASRRERCRDEQQHTVPCESNASPRRSSHWSIPRRIARSVRRPSTPLRTRTAHVRGCPIAADFRAATSSFVGVLVPRASSSSGRRAVLRR